MAQPKSEERLDTKAYFSTSRNQLQVTQTQGQNFPNILHFDLKETTFAFGHFKTIYGHFFANFIDIFHKN